MSYVVCCYLHVCVSLHTCRHYACVYVGLSWPLAPCCILGAVRDGLVVARAVRRARPRCLPHVETCIIWGTHNGDALHYASCCRWFYRQPDGLQMMYTYSMHINKCKSFPWSQRLIISSCFITIYSLLAFFLIRLSIFPIIWWSCYVYLHLSVFIVSCYLLLFSYFLVLF